MNRFLNHFCSICLGFLACLTSTSAISEDHPLITRNVILITLDGVRIQDIFGGLDDVIALHDEQDVYSETPQARVRYAGSSTRQRAMALMPFFWGTLAPQGIVLGSTLDGNHVKVQNQVLWSSPGYAELLTGQPQPEVVNNSSVRHGNRTALEIAKEQLNLGYGQVVEFGSWGGFKLAAASQDDAFLMVGPYDGVPEALSTPEIDYLAGLRKQVMGLWEEGSNDVLTFRMAQAYLKAQQPRVMWLALVNSDDWAHADRYDRYLAYLHLVDSLLGELWATLQSIDQYRDKTTLIITTDHGRGRQGSDWAEHEINIPGSDDIWIAVIGPDTPDIGVVSAAYTVYQGQVAATLLELLAVDYRLLGEGAAPPIDEAVQ